MMDFRVLANECGPEVRFNDYLSDGARLLSAGGCLQITAEQESIVANRFCLIGGGGDVAQRLEFHTDRLGADGEICLYLRRRYKNRSLGNGASHFDTTKPRDERGGFRFLIRPGELAAFHGDNCLWRQEATGGADGEPQTLLLATLGTEFRMEFDGRTIATGNFEPGSGDNEGVPAIVLRDAAMTLRGYTRERIARDADPPRWRRAEPLYRETFEPGSFEANWVRNGEKPELPGDAFVFQPMSNCLLTRRFDGPLAMDCVAEPLPSPRFSAGVTDAIFLWMLDAPGGDVPAHLAALPGASLAHLMPLPLYWVDMGGSNNVTTRLRRNPGRHLMRQFSDRPHLLEPGRTYRVTTVQNGPWIEFWVDGERWIAAWDSRPHTAGHLGFRAFVAPLRVSEMSVWRIE